MLWEAGKGRGRPLLFPSIFPVSHPPDRPDGEGPQEQGRHGRATWMSTTVIFSQPVVWKAPQQMGGAELWPCRPRCTFYLRP